MAYRREWDSGREYDDYNRGYDHYGGKGYDPHSRNGDHYDDRYQQKHPRAREEDDYESYAGTDKRRKYNEQAETSYRSGDWDQSRDYDYTDQSQEDRKHRSRRLVPSEATQHVIFLGLDLDHTEGDLQAYLQGMNCSLDSVTIIRDRGTGTCTSKGFGFAQFTSVEAAKAFLTPNFPFINIPPPASHGASALAIWKQAIASGGGPGQQQGRRVKIDFSQSAHTSDRARGRVTANDGTRDIGTSPAPIILLRGIDGVTTPAAVAVALRVANGPGREGAKGLKRVLLIKDRLTGLGSGFAFLEFVDQQSASHLLGAIMDPRVHPTGFRVNDKPVAASYAHPFSFQLLAETDLRDDATVPSSKHLGGGNGHFVRYWDEGSSVAEMTFEVEEPEEEDSPVVAEKKKKKVNKAGDFEVAAFLGSVSEGIHAAEMAVSALPVSDKPVTLSLKKTATVISKPTMVPVRAAIAGLGFGGDGEDDQGLDIATQGIKEDQKVASAKKVAPLIASKKVVNRISKWNSVQEELSGKAPTHVPAPTQTVLSGPSLNSSKQQPLIGDNNEQNTTVKPPLVSVNHGDFEYADSKKMACYLCSRQFKSLEQLQRHNKESDLHKKNLQDPSLRDIAQKKALTSTDVGGSEAAKYRDRAQERRVLHNQPNAPVPEGGVTSKRKQEVRAVTPPPVAPVAPAKDETNVGNKLLQKMGWAQGMGLGTEGEGRVDPIETAIFAQGAGLGASKGKDISQFAPGYSGYVNMAKDSARDRYDEPR